MVRLHPKACHPGILATLAAALTLILLPTRSAAQSAAQPCSSCRFALAPVATIPTHSNGVIVRPFSYVGYSAGAFVMAPTWDGGVGIWHDDSMKEIGRVGGGPREFRSRLPHGFGVADDGQIFLAHANVLTTLAPRAADFLSSTRIDVAAARLVPVGEVLVALQMTSREMVVLKRDGSTRSRVQAPVQLGWMEMLHASASGDSALWVGAEYTYGAHLLDLQGRVLKTVTRSPRWFASEGYVAGMPTRVKPAPRMVGVLEISPDVLLFLIHVADRDWKRVASAPLDRLDFDQLFDTVIDLVDARTGELLTSTRYDPRVLFVRGSPYLWMRALDTAGEPVMSVVQPHFSKGD